MTCQLNLVPLSCDRQGVGFVKHPLASDSNKLHLITGHAKHFPRLEGQQYFYVRIEGCDGCCEVAKVVGIEQDTFTLDRTEGSKCACINSNAIVKYDWDNIRVIQDVVASIGINVLSPLKYDHCTRTLSVDCKELFAADCGGCGCGEGAISVGGGTGQQGLRGPKGDKGDAGIGIKSLKATPAGMLTYTLTDGTVGNAGRLPAIPGPPGPMGQTGAAGEAGATGASGAVPQHIEFKDGKAVFHMTDGSVVEAEAKSLTGAAGAKGETGAKGDKGDTGYSFQYVESGDKAFIFGTPNTDVTIISPNMPGVTLGPYRTKADGSVEFQKPSTQGAALFKLNAGGKLVGIGKSG